MTIPSETVNPDQRECKKINSHLEIYTNPKPGDLLSTASRLQFRHVYDFYVKIYLPFRNYPSLSEVRQNHN